MADQLGRTSTSIVLNIAEGAGKFSQPVKGATSWAQLVPEVRVAGKAMLERITAMVVKLAKAQET